METHRPPQPPFVGSRGFWFWLGGLLFLTGLWMSAALHTTGIQYNHRGATRLDKLSMEFAGGCVSFQWSPFYKSSARPGSWTTWLNEGTGIDLWPEVWEDRAIPNGSRLLRLPLWPLPLIWSIGGAWSIISRQRRMAARFALTH